MVAAMEGERARRGPQCNLTLDECMALPPSARMCGLQADENTMTAMLCGSAPPCDCVGPGSRTCPPAERQLALQTALANMDQYTVVGLHERLDAFFPVLHCRVPALGPTPQAPGHERITAGGYLPPSNKTRAAVAAMLDLDVVLYRHAQERFARDLNACFPHGLPEAHK
jgi:hypothetical protein